MINQHQLINNSMKQIILSARRVITNSLPANSEEFFPQFTYLSTKSEVLRYWNWFLTVENKFLFLN
jgi:hypothetical protein